MMKKLWEQFLYPRETHLSAVVSLFAVVLMMFCPGETEAQYGSYFTPQEALEIAFAKGETVRVVTWQMMSAESRTAIVRELGRGIPPGSINCYQGSMAGRVVNYACIDTIRGFQSRITFLIKISHPEGGIAHYEIMYYGDPRGNNMRHGPFRAQFIGKKLTDPMEYGVDVRNMTGATKSASALRDGLRKMLIFYQYFLKDLPLLTEKKDKMDEH